MKKQMKVTGKMIREYLSMSEAMMPNIRLMSLGVTTLGIMGTGC